MTICFNYYVLVNNTVIYSVRRKARVDNFPSRDVFDNP